MRGVITFVVEGRDRRTAIVMLQELGFTVGGREIVEHHALDTADRRLARSGLTLGAAVRPGPGPVTVTLTDGRGDHAQAEATTMPRHHRDLPLGMRDRLAVITPRVLLPMLTIHADQSIAELRNRDGKVVARATVLRDVVDASGAVLAPLLVELRALAGYEPAATPSVRALSGLASSTHPGTALACAVHLAGITLDTDLHPRRVRLDPAAPAIDGFRTVLAELATTIRANRAGAAEDLDIEFLHDLRIATRRTRTVLAHARQALPPDVLDRARTDFAWLGAATGPARDLDVALVEWDADMHTFDDGVGAALAPLRERLLLLREDAHRDLADQLTSPRFDTMLDDWTEWLERPAHAADLPDGAGKPLGVLIGRRVQRAFAKVIQEGRLIGSASPPEQLHALRKDAKKLRYLFDCFGGLMNASALRPVSRPLKGLLTTLGEHQDSEVRTVQLARLHAGAADVPEPALAAFAVLLDGRRQAARDEFEHRFRAFDRRQVHHAVRDAMERLRR